MNSVSCCVVKVALIREEEGACCVNYIMNRVSYCVAKVAFNREEG